MVVHLLVTGGADPGLRDLPTAQQRQLVRDMTQLRFINRETLAEVIAEFARELDSIGLHIPRDPAKVLSMLDSQLSLEVIEELSAELGDDLLPGHGHWDKVATLEPEVLVELIDSESDEVSAIVLSKMPPARAADMIRLLPRERADQIAAAFARTDGVASTAVTQIGIALGRETAARKAPVFEMDGVKRVGDILNAATARVRRGIMETLEMSNPDFAARVRAVVFSFENIPDRVAPRDMPRVIRNIDSEVLITALAGIPQDDSAIADFILTTISKRLGDQLREEIEDRSSPTPDEYEDATATIVGVIREMEEEGVLSLSLRED